MTWMLLGYASLAPTLARQGPVCAALLVASGENLFLGQVFRRERAGLEGGAGGLVGGDLILVAQRQGDVVQALHERPPHVVVDLEGARERACAERLIFQRHGDPRAGFCLEELPQKLAVFLGDDAGHQALLPGVSAENIGELGGEDNAEAVVFERPHRVLARGAGAEVRSGDQDGALPVGVLVEDEVGVGAPGGEEGILEAGSGDALEVDGRDDLVGVDVGAAQRNADAGVRGELFHGCISLFFVGGRGRGPLPRGSGGSGSQRSAGEDRVPRTAVAAATSGDTRWVRLPLP